MKLKVSELKDTLEAVKIGLASVEVVEQSNRVIFEDGKAITFNDEMMAIANSPFDEDFTGAVSAKELIALLNKFKSESTIQVTIKESSLEILSKGKGKKTKAGINFSEEITLPVDEVGSLDDLKWKKLPKGFSEGLGIISSNASRDGSASILQCVHVSGKCIEATDNFNAVRCELDIPKGLPEMCFFHTSAKALSRYTLSKYSLADSWGFFQTKDGNIIALRNFMESDFPVLDKFFDDFEGEEIQIPKTTSEAIQKARIFLDGAESDELVSFSCKKGWVCIAAEGATGYLEEKTKVEKGSPEFDMEINIDQLEYISHNATHIEFSDTLARVCAGNITHISTLR